MINILSKISKIHLTKLDKIFLSNFVKQEASLKSLINLAQEHGVAGLLFHHLEQLELTELLSKSDFSCLQNIYKDTEKNSLSIMAKAWELSQIAGIARIKVMALQGLSIIRFYKNPGLRPMGDIDIMVSSSEKDIFIHHLYNAGYIPIPAYPDLLVKNGFILDIHTHILNLDRIGTRKYLFPQNMTPMWDNAVSFFEHENKLLCLNPYDNLIALCAHVLKHSYSRMIWLTDIYELLLFLCRKEPDVWEILTKRVHFWKQEKVVLYALLLIENLFCHNIPSVLKKELGISKLSVMEKLIINLLLNGFSSDELCIFLWLCNIRGIKRKIRFIMENIFPEKKIMMQIFYKEPGNTGYGNYIKRTLNTWILIWKNLFQALKLIMKTGQGFFIYK